MKKQLLIGVLVALGLAAGATAAAPPPEVPALTRIASRLSGLKVQHRVTVRTLRSAAIQAQALRLLDRDYPREQQAYDETVYRTLGLLKPTQRLRPLLVAGATKNVLGLYDAQRHVLYVRRGSGRRAALLSGLVRALEDQAFDLSRMSGLRRNDRDASLGAAAAVEGDATFASALTSRRSAAVANPIVSFLQLERQFPQTVGLRFVTTLQNLGGKRAIFSALKRFPITTEQVFHVDAFLTREPALQVQLPTSAAGLSLQRSDTFGELDVRALLAVFQVPRLGEVGTGWGGGRTAIYTDATGHRAVSLVLDWDTGLDAKQWAEAVTTYVNEAFDPNTPGFPATAPCGATTCWSLGDHQIAFAVNGARTALVFADSLATADVLAALAVGHA